MVETERGCGYRKIGGAYLIGTGMAANCDRLPILIQECQHCGFGIGFARSMQIVKTEYVRYLIDEDDGHHPSCEDVFPCPICYNTDTPADPLGKKVGIMFVSNRYYTPESFAKESVDMGISKRIAPHTIPKAFKTGMWIMLVYTYPDKSHKIFYAFKPERIEILVWKDDPKKAEYEKKGFTVVEIERTPENELKHTLNDRKRW